MTQHIPVNFGLVYKHQDWAHLRMSYERGDTFTAGLTLTTNFNDLYATWLDEPEPNFVRVEWMNRLIIRG